MSLHESGRGTGPACQAAIPDSSRRVAENPESVHGVAAREAGLGEIAIGDATPPRDRSDSPASQSRRNRTAILRDGIGRYRPDFNGPSVVTDRVGDPSDVPLVRHRV